MSLLTSLFAALGAAASFAVAAVTQQLATRTVSRGESMHLGLLLQLVRRPVWLIGTAAMLAGYGLQALALAYGPIAFVQPIVVTELAFAIPLAMWLGNRRPGVHEWLGLTAVVVGVSLFLLGALPAPGTTDPPFTAWLSALVPAALVVVAVLATAARARGRARALLLGAAAGVSFGVIAVLTKTTTYLLGQGLGTAARAWQPYALIGVDIFALVCSQSAYQAGPIAYSMPLHDLLEPAVAVTIGATVFEETLPGDALSLAIAVLGGVMACAGIVELSRSPIVHGMSVEQDEDGADAAPGKPGVRRTRPEH